MTRLEELKAALDAAADAADAFEPIDAAAAFAPVDAARTAAHAAVGAAFAAYCDEQKKINGETE
jgi:hypothetical protein